MPLLRKIAAIAAVIAATAGATEVEEEELRRIEGAIDEGRERRDTLDARAGEIEKEISALQVALIAAAAKAQDMEGVVSDLEAGLAALAAEERAKNARLRERRGELAATLGALARLGRRPPEAMIEAGGAAIDTVRGSMVLAAVAPELGAEARALGAEIEALDLLRLEIDAEQAALVAARRALGKEARAIERLVRRKANTRSRTVAERAAESERLAALAAEARTCVRYCPSYVRPRWPRREATSPRPAAPCLFPRAAGSPSASASARRSERSPGASPSKPSQARKLSRPMTGASSSPARFVPTANS